MERNYFKRLQYHKEDIPSVPFHSLKIVTEGLPYEKIQHFLQDDQNAQVFDIRTTERTKNTGLGKNFIDEVHQKCNAGYAMNIPPSDEAKSIFIHCTFDAQNPTLYDQHYIHLLEGARAKLFIYIDTDKTENSDFFRSGIVSIDVEKNAHLELIKVQNMDARATHFESVKITVYENAVVNIYDIHLGACVDGSSISTYLYGDNASVAMYPLYFIDGTRRMDLEQNLIIYGKDTQSSIHARGAIKNKAKKTCRGNIFFERGCAKSKARFADSNIMLDKTVYATSIPTIFCDEDDVIGEHAASFEAINQEKLYYLMARGFNEIDAKKLIIKASFRPVFAMIDDKTVKKQLIDQFEASLNQITE